MQKLPFTTALFVAIVSSGAISKAATLYQDDRYAPQSFGIPDTIGEYAVLAVLTEDNFACMKPGEKRLVLQSLQPDIDGALRGFPKEQREFTLWESNIIGPGLTRWQLVSQLERSYRYFKVHGCATLQLPLATNCPTTCTCLNTGGGECTKTDPYQGYTIIQNTDIHTFCPPNSSSLCPVNAQSVILVAPVVGHNQDGIYSEPVSEAAQQKLVKECGAVKVWPYCRHHPGYSAFLNNGMTDKGYFLQVGFYFTNKATVAANGVVSPGDETCRAPAGCFGDGFVVWAGAPPPHKSLEGHSQFSSSSNAQPATIPYIPGHHYYTTITRTSGVWWTCAADLADASTYQCQNHPNAQGDHLVEDMMGTNVFAEVWNQNRSWAGGFTIQWPAYGATTYVNGMPKPWQSQAIWTLHSCPDNWPTTNAVVGSLVPDGRQFNDGWAFFNADGYIPPFCW